MSISNQMFGKVDMEKYASGMKRHTNFIPTLKKETPMISLQELYLTILCGPFGRVMS